MGGAAVAGCNAPPALLPGEERLDFVTLAIQPLAVVDWFLAAVTGRDALLGQHPTDFAATLPLIPDHCCHRRQVFAQHISTGEVTALPLTQVESQVTTFTVTDPMELAGHALLGTTNQAGPLIEAGRRGIGFDVSGVNHQDRWLWGIRRLCGVGWLWGIGC